MNSNVLNDIHKRECEEKLREAASTGDFDVVKRLVEKGVDVNSQNIINHWTALHWSCKRRHSSIVSYLLDHGADPSLVTINHETCWQLAPDFKPSFAMLEGEKTTNTSNDNLPFIPNYLAHPVFPYGRQAEGNSYQNGNYQESMKLSTPTSEREFYDRNYNTTSRELVLKIKLKEERDFIEVDFPNKNHLTYNQLLDEMCKELDAPVDCNFKIRKLPNTIIRNDKDVRRLNNFQELELIINM